MNEQLLTSSPVIVIGMHRSGTRLVADLLDRMGVFMGADRQGDAESLTFLRINEAIFHQCGTFWSEPLPVHVLLGQPAQVERMAGLVRETLDTESNRFIGESGWTATSATGGARPFGWKDPRNTFTLPVWKRLFPHARVVHVVRHGIDVAASLARRQRQVCLSATGESVPSPLAVFEDHAFGVLSSRRGWTVHEALAMWEEYVEKARMASADPASGFFEIRFEDLLARPAEVIPALARFCDLPVPERSDGFLPGLDPGRAFAYKRDPALTAFAASARDILLRYGYEP